MSSLANRMLIVYGIYAFCLLLASAAPNRCTEDPKFLSPNVNETNRDFAIDQNEGADVIFQCSAQYAVKWVKLKQQGNQLPISYAITPILNSTTSLIIDQINNNTLHLIQLADDDPFPIYGCVSSEDFGSLKQDPNSSSTLDQMRLTKIYLRIKNSNPAAAAPARDDSESKCAKKKTLKAEALLQTLNGDLLASPSATKTLEKWCGDHKLSEQPKIIAKTLNPAEMPAPPEAARTALRISPNDTIKYRNVELSCGEKVLSIADNWYVSDRLTPEMNRELDHSNTPFGKVISPLEPYRRTSLVNFLWRPLPDGWEMKCVLPKLNGILADLPLLGSKNTDLPLLDKEIMPDRILQHQAIVLTKDGLPISFVDERYTKSMFDFLV